MTVLESDFTQIEDQTATTHDAYPAFVREMAGRSYGHEALNDAWVWFKLGWEWSRRSISYQCPQRPLTLTPSACSAKLDWSCRSSVANATPPNSIARNAKRWREPRQINEKIEVETKGA